MSSLLNPNHLDVEFPEHSENETSNLRLLVVELKKRVRILERELEGWKKDYMRPRIIENGLDLHPAWDYVANCVAPAVHGRDECPDRKMMAEWSLYGTLMNEERNVSYVAVMLDRIAHFSMGSVFCRAWKSTNREEIMKKDTKGLVRKIRNSIW